MLNIDETNQFGIIWEIYDRPEHQYQSLYGLVAIVIGENMEIIPRYVDSYTTLQVVFSNLKASFINPYYSGGTDGKELGEIEVDYKKMDYGEIPNLLEIECTELGSMRGDYLGGLILNLGYSSEHERLFYSSNGGKSYNEIRLSRGTVESVVMSLPSEDELIKLKVKGNEICGTKVIKTQS